MSYVTCAKCGQENSGGAQFYCMNCGASLKGIPRVEPKLAQPIVGQSPQQTAYASTPYAPSVYSASSYAGLRSIAALCSGLGWLVVGMTGLGVIGSLIIMFNDNFLAGLGGILFSLVIGGLCFLFLRVIAEGISVFLDIEANSRQVAINSQTIISLLERRPN